jgi:hypothetical protein
MIDRTEQRDGVVVVVAAACGGGQQGAGWI